MISRIVFAFLMSLSIALSYGQTFSFIHNSLVRSYIVHLPTNYDPANQYPLVINMHGFSNTAAIQETYTGMNTVADTGNFILIYPDGISTTWNAGFLSPYNSGVDDVGFISALLDTAIANYSIDTLRVYACGMSNGGYMSYRLACELENRFAAIASVTGSMPDSMEFYCQNNRAVPVMQVHGTTDPTVNYNGGPGFWSIEATVDYWVQKNNCLTTPINTAVPNISTLDLCTAETFHYASCDASTEVLFYKITGGGHTWPGAIPIPVLGNTNQDFNASGEIWKFFLKHSLPQNINSIPSPDVTNVELGVWPNPSSGSVTISGRDIMAMNLIVTSLLGQEIPLPPIIQKGKGSIELNISELNNGIYLIRAAIPEGVITGKFIKY